MQQVPGRILTSPLRHVPALLLVMALLALFGPSTARANLVVTFDQTAYSGDVWLQVQGPSAIFQATYGSGQSISFNGSDLMSAPVKLSDIGSGGLNISYSSGAVLFLYYDDPTSNDRTAAPAYMTSTQRFQPFELTMTGGTGDQGNLTAINYFTAPMGIASYSSNPSATPAPTPLQQTGYGSTTATQIGTTFKNVTNSNANAYVANDKGQPIRYLGPSCFTSNNPWPSFLPYMLSVNAANQSTAIQRSNGFNFAPPNQTPVYQFGGDMTAQVDAQGNITMSGNITVSANASITPGNPELPAAGYWPNATITISSADIDDYNTAIYGQTLSDAVTFTGDAWSTFKNFTKTTLVDPGAPHDTSTNPSLYDMPINAYNTTVNMLIGEITTGILGGFLNSNYQAPGGQLVKNMTSNSWWSMDPIVAFSPLQPSNPYYNQYAAVIFEQSNNSVYGIPYSDRFGQGPLVNTVQYNNTDVAYWVISVGAPLGAPAPAKHMPSVALSLLLD